MAVALSIGRKTCAVAVIVAASFLDATGQTETHRRMERVNSGANRLALKGYDPVGYHEGWAQKGKPQFVQTYMGVRYQFSSDDHLSMFRDDPGRYEPACGGWCSTAMLKGERVDINPKRFRKIGGRIYLFGGGLFGDASKAWDRLAQGEGEQALADRADAQWQRILNP